MTLLAHDEADVVDAHVAFHLNAGVDLVIATDHRSSDGTTEILERYARQGYVHLIDEQREEYLESEFMTRMARLAATEHGADWVINSAADEFWWPRGGDLKQVLAAVPSRYEAVQAVIRNFLPRQAAGSFFAERMTVRLTLQAPVNDPASPWRSYSKMIHRAHPTVTVGRGSHTVSADRQLLTLRGWYPIEVLHFGVRSIEQSARKAVVMQRAFAGSLKPATGYHTRAYLAVKDGASDEHFAGLAVSDEDVTRGVAEGLLVVDTRLRDALRALRDESTGEFVVVAGGAPRLRFHPATVVEDAGYAVEIAVLGEADVVRLRRDLEQLEQRVARIERAPLQRIKRLAFDAARAVRRGRG